MRVQRSTVLLLPPHHRCDALMLSLSVASPNVKSGETMRGDNRVLICEDGEEMGYRERETQTKQV
jgi:hemin uptake protein HemP